MKWNRNLMRTYSTTWFSEANIFCLVIYYLAITIPFYLSFGTDSFWTKEYNDVYQTTFTYNGDYIVYLTYTQNQMQNKVALSNVVGLNLRNSNFAITLDGTISSSSNTFSGTIRATDSTITLGQVQVYLFFDVNIVELKRSFTATATLAFDLTKSSVISIIGAVSLRQLVPLTRFSESSATDDSSPFIQNQVFLTDINQIISNIGKSNNQVALNSQTLYFPSNNGAASISIKLFSPGISQIRYYPSFIETLRNAFSQYLSVLIATVFLARWLLTYLASHKIFPVHVQQREFLHMTR